MSQRAGIAQRGRGSNEVEENVSLHHNSTGTTFRSNPECTQGDSEVGERRSPQMVVGQNLEQFSCIRQVKARARANRNLRVGTRVRVEDITGFRIRSASAYGHPWKVS